MRICRAFVLLFVLIFLSVPAAVDALSSELVDSDSFDTLSDTAPFYPEGWSFGGWYTDESDYYITTEYEEGRGSVVHINNTIDNDIRLHQTVSVEKNSYYRLSCDIRTQNVVNGAGANVSVEDSVATSEALTGTNDWTHVELAGKTGKDQTELTVCIRVGGYSALSTGEAWFDGFTMEKLEEAPASYADFFNTQSQQTDEVSFSSNIPYIGPIILTVIATAACCLAFYRKCWNAMTLDNSDSHKYSWVGILIAAFIVRIVLSMLVTGHPTDIYCFMSWGSALYEHGPQSFYTSGMFADYPPGYMYVLWLTAAINRLLGLEYGSAGYAFITKLPAIAADIFSAYLIYRIARKSRVKEQTALWLCAFIAFNPVMTFISAGWGQVDSVLTLMLVTAIYLFINDRKILCGLVYGAAILVKPQALMAGPLLASAYIYYIIDTKSFKAVLKTVLAVIAAVAFIYLASLPFKSTQEPLWIADKLIGTATSYPYASIEAYNLMALLGGNWKPVDSTMLIFSYRIWGTVLMGLSIVYSIVLYTFGRKKNAHSLTLTLAFLLSALFTLGQYMHERYLFPVLLLLAIAYVFYRDRRILVCLCVFTVSLMLNVLGAFVIIDAPQGRGAGYDALTFIGSLMNIAGFAYLVYTSTSILINGKVRFSSESLNSQKQTLSEPQREMKPILPPPVSKERLFTRKDRICAAALTAVYAIVAIVNLGSLTAPETQWYGVQGDSAVITLEREADISQIRIFGGLYTGSATITAPDGSEIVYDQTNDEMFRWEQLYTEAFTADELMLNVTSGKIWINEIAVFDTDNKQVRCFSSGDAAALSDEQDSVPQTPSYMNGMYFDELYHARTAYEHLNGLEPYENSHPPLGKVFIMLGIAVFGMNAFGWRIVGTLFGIAMVPIMYAFAKRLFKKTEFALLAAGLFAFDFMHFTQTRIATIDVYAVFFILLMFYYMYRYCEMNFYSDGLKSTLKPLALSGLFFGIGTSCKWICIYAGAGLAVMLFASLIKRYSEYRALLRSDDEHDRTLANSFAMNTIYTLLWCCAFFIAVPVGVYLLSYIPYYLCVSHYDLEGVWGVQEFMFSYHSSLTATHSYQSPWWQWPLILRPMWYYVGYDVAQGNISTISAMGNPAVWWTCLAGTAAFAVMLIKKKLRFDNAALTLTAGVCANLLPWVLVTRCTFIYHYFATVPFIILCTVYVLSELEKRSDRWKNVKWIWLGATVAMFIVFYPVISGLECPRWYVTVLEWLPGWTFMGV